MDISLLSLFLPVAYTLIQILLLLALGYWLARYRGWNYSFFKNLSRFIVKIALPIYFFVRVSKTNIPDLKKGLLFPLAALLIVATGVAISALVFRFIPLTHKEKRAGMGMASFGNSAYIPITLIEIFPVTLPLVAQKFGLAIPTLYIGTYLLVLSPLLWSVGNFLVSGSSGKIKVGDFISAPLLGIVSGFAVVLLHLQPLLFNPQLPFFHIYKALDRIAPVTLPLIMISLGSMIANLSYSKDKKFSVNKTSRIQIAAAVSFIRFLFFPGLFFSLYFLFLRKLSLSPAQIWVIFLEMHIPPATNLSVMAAQAGVNEDAVSFTLLFTYIIYLFLLPLYLLLFLSLPGILY